MRRTTNIVYCAILVAMLPYIQNCTTPEYSSPQEVTVAADAVNSLDCVGGAEECKLSEELAKF